MPPEGVSHRSKSAGPTLKDKIVGYYVSGPDGREDFATRQEAQAAYDALAGQTRHIGRWRQRVRRVPRYFEGMTVETRQRSRYGEVIESEVVQ